jgi:hypothetical protein
MTIRGVLDMHIGYSPFWNPFFNLVTYDRTFLLRGAEGTG